MSENLWEYGGRRWLWVDGISAALLTGSYLLYRRQEIPHGGTPMGLTYGVLGTLLIGVLMALGVRKRLYGSRLGTLRGWTAAHIYLGLLTLVLIPLHAGFKFRPDVHTLAFALLCLVVASGVIGVVLYQVLPPRLTKLEQHIQADKVDRELARLVEEMRALAKNKSDQFARVCQEEIHRLGIRSHQGWRVLWAPAGTDPVVSRGQELTRTVTQIPAAEHDAFQTLSRLILQAVQLERSLVAQMRLRNALQAWLYVHLPLSCAMVAAVVIHLIVVFYY